jgi:hypothetical protein
MAHWLRAPQGAVGGGRGRLLRWRCGHVDVAAGTVSTAAATTTNATAVAARPAVARIKWRRVASGQRRARSSPSSGLLEKRSAVIRCRCCESLPASRRRQCCRAVMLWCARCCALQGMAHHTYTMLIHKHADTAPSRCGQPRLGVVHLPVDLFFFHCVQSVFRGDKR